MFSPGIEPGTFCVLDRCDNRYTTKTCCNSHVPIGEWHLPDIKSFILPTLCANQFISLASRDRLVVRTLRCGRSNPGSNPGHGINILTIQLVKKKIKIKTIQIWFF